MRHIHSEYVIKFISSMVCRSEKRFLIVTDKIKRTFIFVELFEDTFNQINFFFFFFSFIRLWGNVV